MYSNLLFTNDIDHVQFCHHSIRRVYMYSQFSSTFRSNFSQTSQRFQVIKVLNHKNVARIVSLSIKVYTHGTSIKKLKTGQS